MSKQHFLIERKRRDELRRKNSINVTISLRISRKLIMFRKPQHDAL